MTEFEVVPEAVASKMTFYRFEDQNIWSYLPDKPREVHYDLVRETECGYWVRERSSFSFGEKDRWVSKNAKKRLCYPSRQDALVSYAARKRRQIGFLEGQLHRARHWSSVAQKLLGEPSVEESKGILGAFD